MSEILPPWIRYPDYPPMDPFWRQTGEYYKAYEWDPYWQSLDPEEKTALLEKWPMPADWKAHEEFIEFFEAREKIFDKKTLITLIEKNHGFDYLFFWEHNLPEIKQSFFKKIFSKMQKNDATKHCLSQFFPAHFVVDATTYPSAEHYMMSEKAKLFEDFEIFSKILNTHSPHQAKALGKKIQNFDESIWEQHRFEIVVKGNFEKFSQNTELKKFLSNTGDAILVEASPIDPIWGIGMTEDNANAHDPKKWRGLNLLGFALMKVRSLL